jgi:hypothetical protein
VSRRYVVTETRRVVVDLDDGWVIDSHEDPVDEALEIATDCLVPDEWDTLDRQVEAL